MQLVAESNKRRNMNDIGVIDGSKKMIEPTPGPVDLELFSHIIERNRELFAA
jgi:hypothetical protein